MTWSAWRKSPGVALSLALGVGVSFIVLAWFGVRASQEWQRSSALLVQRRADEAANLLVTALTRDMRAAQATVLLSAAWDSYSFESPYDVMSTVASAFARYPYPECFFAWRGADAPARVTLFTRSGRPPGWALAGQDRSRYPVRLDTNERFAAALLERVAPAVAQGHTLSIVEFVFDGITYQVIARLRYHDRVRQQLDAVVGFVVNVAWVRQHYFTEFAREIARVGGDDSGLALGLFDDENAPVAVTRPFVDHGLVSRRSFPFAFYDTAATPFDVPSDVSRRPWSAVASAAADPALVTAIRGSRSTVLLAAGAAAVLAGGLVLMVRAVRASARLATLRAEFVSSVTHELKTPITSIRALGDTLTSGRIRSAEAQREYAVMVVQEAKRLARLVDNLLAHARVTDIADAYVYERVDLGGTLHAALDLFRQPLLQGGFRVTEDIPPDLPAVWADPSAIDLVFDNLIDNALKYSRETRELIVTARDTRRGVLVSIADRGIGIPREDLEAVTHKFVRGRNAISGGSGLGLAIVHRVVRDHGGSLSIASTLHEGTTVTVVLPTAPGRARTIGAAAGARASA